MNYLNYRWQLNKLQRQRAKALFAYQQERQKAERDKKSRDEIDGIIAVEMHETDMIDEEIDLLEQRYLVESAEKLVLPTPGFSEDSSDWHESRITGRYRLSRSAMAMLRAKIRKERKERRDGAIPWITVVTGLIGALIGLLSIMYRNAD